MYSQFVKITGGLETSEVRTYNRWMSGDHPPLMDDVCADSR